MYEPESVGLGMVRIVIHKKTCDGSWALPARGIEVNESIFQCLQREDLNSRQHLQDTGLIIKRKFLKTLLTHALLKDHQYARWSLLK